MKKGKTPVLSAEEARGLLDEIDLSTLAGLRDWALIGVLVFSFSRVSAAVSMRVADYYTQGKRSFFRLHEKGGWYSAPQRDTSRHRFEASPHGAFRVQACRESCQTAQDRAAGVSSGPT